MRWGIRMGQYFGKECQEVVPGLYIGHLGCARDAAVLRSYGIRRVVDVSAQDYTVPSSVDRLRLPIPDVSDYDVRQIIAATNQFIHEGVVNKENVLVHCHWGISRSAAVVVAYLMAFHHMTLEQALNHLQTKRTVVQPNRGFMQFLKLYQ